MSDQPKAGGKPSKGTPADKRLSENSGSASTAVPSSGADWDSESWAPGNGNQGWATS